MIHTREGIIIILIYPRSIKFTRVFRRFLAFYITPFHRFASNHRIESRLASNRNLEIWNRLPATRPEHVDQLTCLSFMGVAPLSNLFPFNHLTPTATTDCAPVLGNSNVDAESESKQNDRNVGGGATAAVAIAAAVATSTATSTTTIAANVRHTVNGGGSDRYNIAVVGGWR